MDLLLGELVAGLPDVQEGIRIALRLLVATLLGAVIGWQRERTHKPAGLRTHMLVALGCAVFVVACDHSALDADGLSRVIQGIATGIGFIGAGTILKRPQEGEVHGLTTAASVWLTAAAGVTAGLGRLGIALLGVTLAWLILEMLQRLERPGEHVSKE